MEEANFSIWLENQLVMRSWRSIDLANASGLPPATISRVLNGDRKAGADVASAIADALHLPPEYVFRKAGLLPDENDEELPDPTIRELLAILSKTSEENRREIVEYAIWFLSRKDDSS